MAEILHISRQSYNFYENGQREPKIDMLLKMADYFGVSVDYLLGRSNAPAACNDIEPETAQQRLQNKISIADTETAAEVENYLDYLNAQKNNSKAAAGKWYISYPGSWKFGSPFMESISINVVHTPSH